MTFSIWDAAFKDAGVTLSGGSLTAAISNTGVTQLVRSTVGVGSGKWYWEVHCDSVSDGTVAGVIDSSEVTGNAPGYTAHGDGWVRLLSGVIINNTSTVNSPGSFTTGDVLGIAMDVDARTIKWYKNGSLLATSSGAGNVPSGATWFASVGSTGNAGSNTTTTNFGATSFAFTPPTGYLGLQLLLTFSMTMSGGVSVGGTFPKAPPAFTDMTMSGGVSVGGTFPSQFLTNTTMDGGVSVGGSFPVVMGGSTIYNASDDNIPSGGVIAGGSAVVQEVIPYNSTGGIVAGGAALVQDHIPFTASGGAIGSGAAAISTVFVTNASGGVVAGGTASVVLVSVFTASGGIVAGGAAAVSDRQAFYQATGGVIAGGSALAYFLAAGFVPTPENPYGDPFPGWAVNYESGAPSRYLGLPANSFAQLNGVTYCANAGGIYAIDAKTDAGQPIRAQVLLPTSDHGDAHNKRLPHVWVGAEMAAAMVMKIVTDNASESYYSVDPCDARMRATMVEPGKGIEGRYFQVGLANVAGADFTLESLELPFSILKRHGR